jgi:DNA-binding NarL/FixJ family response regulator
MDETATNGRDIFSALIVDDHPLFCEALCLTLQAVAGIRQVETASCLEQALQRVAVAPLPDAIILDLNLPDVTGIDGLIRLKAAAGAVPIVVVSSLTSNQVIEAAFEAGASGFVPKHSGRDVFARTFDLLREGGKYLPEGYVAKPKGGRPPSQREKALARLALLTRQQARILQLICEGKLNKQIAYELSISETTVKAHITAIMRKLGAQRRTQAVLIAKEASFATLSPETSEHL